MKSVRQLLRVKSPVLHSIPPDSTVLDALRLLAKEGIGAVLVMDQGRLCGILSERDYARKVALKGKSSHDTPVRDIMVTDLVTVGPDDSSDQCMTLMTDRRIRHLPVVENGEVVGMLSIGDLVKDIISEQASTIEQLEYYIMRS